MATEPRLSSQVIGPATFYAEQVPRESPALRKSGSAMAVYMRAAQRREQVLQAALEVMARDGLDAMSMRAVAAQAGIGLATVQHVFPTKGELVTAMTARVLNPIGPDAPPVLPGGLSVELARNIEMLSQWALPDRNVVELIRSHMRAALSTGGPDEARTYPLTEYMLGQTGVDRITQAADIANEAYALPLDHLARLWSQVVWGLLAHFMLHRDVDRFHQEGMFAAHSLITLADPRPR